MPSLKIQADTEKCQGHARCYAIAPELFALDEEGYIGFDEKIIASDQEQKVRQGIRACPEHALRMRKGEE
ncbi:ferredoxin [Spongiibacter tropicus]|uniref:ferredoxin n=1 Tax=Spongiibacter tropicus TaxID=454602 RepID=UPI0024E21FDA|nr:ferredoxin [Spongiibacter tropicus]